MSVLKVPFEGGEDNSTSGDGREMSNFDEPRGGSIRIRRELADGNPVEDVVGKTSNHSK